MFTGHWPLCAAPACAATASKPTTWTWTLDPRPRNRNRNKKKKMPTHTHTHQKDNAHYACSMRVLHNHLPCSVFINSADLCRSTTAAELCRSLKYHSPTLCYTSRPGLRTYLPESVVPLPLSKDTTCQSNNSNQ
jgi:hypothetical protein